MISPSHGEGRGFNSHSVHCFAFIAFIGIHLCRGVVPEVNVDILPLLLQPRLSLHSIFLSVGDHNNERLSAELADIVKFVF